MDLFIGGHSRNHCCGFEYLLKCTQCSGLVFFFVAPTKRAGLLIRFLLPEMAFACRAKYRQFQHICFCCFIFLFLVDLLLVPCVFLNFIKDHCAKLEYISTTSFHQHSLIPVLFLRADPSCCLLKGCLVNG